MNHDGVHAAPNILEGDDILTLSQLFNRRVFARTTPEKTHLKTNGLNKPVSFLSQQTLANKYTAQSSPLVFMSPSAEGLSEQEKVMTQTIYALTGALEAKDAYTCGHSRAVALYATHLCSALQLEGETIEHIRLAALLHDIGKIGISESILNKEGPLTPAEWQIMKQHPVIGARKILSPLAGLTPILPYVEHHHEHWDGSGDPMGLAGEQIPLGARIVAIVDAYHALTSRRCYREALSKPQAVTILRNGAGSTWDPTLMEIFLRVISR
ncbi:MAG: HD-GYP domain-containing protein [Vampirovibrionales bacterium]|nr:HD-GYP domain-containing protein [Vampirovibrionales bacterium]